MLGMPTDRRTEELIRAKVQDECAVDHAHTETEMLEIVGNDAPVALPAPSFLDAERVAKSSRREQWGKGHTGHARTPGL